MLRWTIEPALLARASRAVELHALRTPLIAAPGLGEGVHLKLETEQRTGSFKFRGALAALSHRDGSRGVVTASAGNHGYGLARAGALLGVPILVFVSRTAPAVKREGIASAGASVREVDAIAYDDVEALAREAADRLGLDFVSPFDDPLVAAGNGGTLGLEILEQLPEVRTIIAPVGGGGLVAGLAAARHTSRASFRLIGVQSEACPAMARSFAEARALTRFVGSSTLAEGLEGGVSETTYAIAREALERMDTVSEDAIADAMRVAHGELGLTIEGSAAVALAWMLDHRGEASLARPAVVLLTGRNVDPARLGAILDRNH